MKAIMALLPPESHEQREPTAAEIALAHAAGTRATAPTSTPRRPGTD